MLLLSKPRRALLDLIKRSGVTTIDEAVRAVSSSKNTVRSHLLKLEELGLVERVQVEGQHRGRPPLAYRVCERAQDAFPTDDGEVLTGLISHLCAHGHKDLVDGFFESMWQARQDEYARGLAGQLGDPERLSTRLRVLKEVLELHHFMPEVQWQGDRLSVKECNCPFPAAVRASRAPCRLEAQFLGHVVGRPPDHVRYSDATSSPCAFVWQRTG